MKELVDYAENTDGLVQLRASYVEASEPANVWTRCYLLSRFGPLCAR